MFLLVLGLVFLLGLGLKFVLGFLLVLVLEFLFLLELVWGLHKDLQHFLLESVMVLV